MISIVSFASLSDLCVGKRESLSWFHACFPKSASWDNFLSGLLWHMWLVKIKYILVTNTRTAVSSVLQFLQLVSDSLIAQIAQITDASQKTSLRRYLFNIQKVCRCRLARELPWILGCQRRYCSCRFATIKPGSAANRLLDSRRFRAVVQTFVPSLMFQSDFISHHPGVVSTQTVNPRGLLCNFAYHL